MSKQSFDHWLKMVVTARIAFNNQAGYATGEKENLNVQKNGSSEPHNSSPMLSQWDILVLPHHHGKLLKKDKTLHEQIFHGR